MEFLRQHIALLAGIFLIWFAYGHLTTEPEAAAEKKKLEAIGPRFLAVRPAEQPPMRLEDPYRFTLLEPEPVQETSTATGSSDDEEGMDSRTHTASREDGVGGSPRQGDGPRGGGSSGTSRETNTNGSPAGGSGKLPNPNGGASSGSGKQANPNGSPAGGSGKLPNPNGGASSGSGKQANPNGSPAGGSGKLPNPNGGASSGSGKQANPNGSPAGGSGKLPNPNGGKSGGSGKLPNPNTGKSGGSGKLPNPNGGAGSAGTRRSITGPRYGGAPIFVTDTGPTTLPPMEGPVRLWVDAVLAIPGGGGSARISGDHAEVGELIEGLDEGAPPRLIATKGLVATVRYRTVDYLLNLDAPPIVVQPQPLLEDWE